MDNKKKLSLCNHHLRGYCAHGYITRTLDTHTSTYTACATRMHVFIHTHTHISPPYMPECMTVSANACMRLPLSRLKRSRSERLTGGCIISPSGIPPNRKSCNFAHGESELRTVVPPPPPSAEHTKLQLCAHFTRSFAFFGPSMKVHAFT